MLKSSLLGYAGAVVTQPYRIDRTARINDREPVSIIPYCIDLAQQNLQDLIKILQWNETKNIYFFRINSDIFPHIANWRCCQEIKNYKNLSYPLQQFQKYFDKIPKTHRLTFHPLPYTILNTPDEFHLISVKRDLYWHSEFLNMCDLGYLCTITLHIGGVYDNKHAAKKRFVKNFNALPANIKKRIIIENDESKYNINDVLQVSQMITPYKAVFESVEYEIKSIPVCFDYFHYCCYNKYFQKDPEKYQKQMKLTEIFEPIWQSWQIYKNNKVISRKPKVHLSEQARDNRLGTHADYIKKIPDILLDQKVDIMLESKQKEVTLFNLLHFASKMKK